MRLSVNIVLTKQQLQLRGHEILIGYLLAVGMIALEQYSLVK